jgi:GNAT superfamily N-acetyltransferase
VSRESGSISVVAADPNAHRASLQELLERYQTWLATSAREWTAERTSTDEEGEMAETSDSSTPIDEEYDPADAAADDVRTIADPDTDARAFLASYDGNAAGVALCYGVSDEMAELKRLYVRPAYRESGLGRGLCEAVVEAAAEQGYERVGLTTPPWSESAHVLYEALDFEYTGPYPETKLPERFHEEALFMQRHLAD